MKVLKNIVLSILMQVLILILHVGMHMARLYELSDSIGSSEEICSFGIVIIITFLWYFILNLPAYTLITANAVTFLFLMLSEETGTYLFYYVHRGSSPFFNPPLLTDAVIVTVGMLFFQLITMALAKLARYQFIDRKKQSTDNNTKDVADGE